MLRWCARTVFRGVPFLTGRVDDVPDFGIAQQLLNLGIILDFQGILAQEILHDVGIVDDSHDRGIVEEFLDLRQQLWV